LRTRIAEKAWRIYSGESVDDMPIDFYRIAEMAIVEVHANVDRMLGQQIRNRLEKLMDD
jgi:hypothetical protein